MNTQQVTDSDISILKLTDSRILITFSLLIIAWLFVYKDTLLSMEAIWSRSDTFAHGYFILPISLWLLWRDKGNLLKSTVKASWLPLPLLVISLFIGLFSYAADIDVLGQLSAVTSLIFILWMLIGDKLAWRYKFPLAYLLFAVPMGESLIPWLQDVTAWFTVYFLNINGIPVYVDGLYIQIPTGMFEVAVACSGIRYLIASAAVGALYAYLTYQKAHKQIIFFIFALTLPILANGIRAYGIVAIAYYSDMEYATGADHLVYGWLFFGLIIMLMFWLGGFFADKPIVKDYISVYEGGKGNTVIPLIGLILFISSHLVMNGVKVKTLTGPPKEAFSFIDGFKKQDYSIIGTTFLDALFRSQIINSEGIEVFRAVYAQKQNKGELISWNNKLFDTERWSITSASNIDFNSFNGRLLNLRDLSGKERTVIYWYEVAGEVLTSKIKVKLMQSLKVYSAPDSTSELMMFSMQGNNKEALFVQVNRLLMVINNKKRELY